MLRRQRNEDENYDSSSSSFMIFASDGSLETSSKKWDPQIVITDLLNHKRFLKNVSLPTFLFSAWVFIFSHCFFQQKQEFIDCYCTSEYNQKKTTTLRAFTDGNFLRDWEAAKTDRSWLFRRWKENTSGKAKKEFSTTLLILALSERTTSGTYPWCEEIFPPFEFKGYRNTLTKGLRAT